MKVLIPSIFVHIQNRHALVTHRKYDFQFHFYQLVITILKKKSNSILFAKCKGVLQSSGQELRDL